VKCGTGLPRASATPSGKKQTMEEIFVGGKFAQAQLQNAHILDWVRPGRAGLRSSYYARKRPARLRSNDGRTSKNCSEPNQENVQAAWNTQTHGISVRCRSRIMSLQTHETPPNCHPEQRGGTSTDR